MSEGVPYSADLERVLALPRRVWTPEAGQELAKWLSAQLLTEAGRAAGWALLPQQAITLWEFYENWRDHRVGFFGALPVGSGKTLIFWLAAYMIGAKRPMLFEPANLRDVDVPRMFEEYKRYWASPTPPPAIEGYSLLSQEPELYVLENRMPDFLGFDECQVFRNYQNTASKRVGGYVDKVREGCVVLAASGTPKRKSVYDYSHIVKWCLRHRAPVPISTDTLQDWSNALDTNAEMPLRPGQLLLMAEQTGVAAQVPGVISIGESARAREGWRRRFSQTPGVLIWDESSCSTQINIRLLQPTPDPLLDKAFLDFRMTNATPDGWPLNEAIEKWNHERQLGCGFFYYWDPRPPEAWMQARYLAAVFCRDMIKATAHLPRVRGSKVGPLDTESAVYKAFPDHPDLLAWKAIEKSFTPNVEAGWISAGVVRDAYAWQQGRAGLTAGLIWCEHDALALAVGQATGLPVYGAGGMQLDAQGAGIPGTAIKQYVDNTPQEKLSSIVLSFKSNYLGRNLQKYGHALSIGWAPSAEYAEQGYLGRFHRQGQKRDVFLDVIMTSALALDAFEATLSEARGVLTELGLTQKILTANIDSSGLANLPPNARWAKPVKDD